MNYYKLLNRVNTGTKTQNCMILYFITLKQLVIMQVYQQH